jgi:hypothetical protein
LAEITPLQVLYALRKDGPSFTTTITSSFSLTSANRIPLMREIAPLTFEHSRAITNGLVKQPKVLAT